MKKISLVGSLMLIMILILTVSLNACSSTPSTSAAPAAPSTSAAAPTTSAASAAPAPATSAPAPSTAAATASPAAAKVIELKYASSNPPPPLHPQSIADAAWIEKIQKETGGRVHITPYWGGALMQSADSWDELVKGVADITEFSGAYVPQGFDIEKAMRILFYGVSSPEVARKVYDEVRSQYPQVDAEFAAAKVMARHAVSPYQVITVKTPVKTLSDFKGLSLKVTGEFGQIAGKVGAIGVTIPMADTYVALQKGTVGGAFTPSETLKSFKFGEVAKYVTILNMAVGPTPHRAMNMKTWNSLPPDIQKVFEDNITWWGQDMEKELFSADDAGIAFAKQNGAQVFNLSDADLKAFYDSVNAVCLENMAKLDAKNIAGTKIYTTIRQLIAKYNQ